MPWLLPWWRYRFLTSIEDPRPIVFPPPGPYWVSGETGDYAIVVAYLPRDVELTDYWPAVEQVDVEGRDGITYTTRFPRPTWWEGE